MAREAPTLLLTLLNASATGLLKRNCADQCRTGLTYTNQVSHLLSEITRRLAPRTHFHLRTFSERLYLPRTPPYPYQTNYVRTAGD
ncbi:hypothetical protein BJY52DRAFT_1280399 [Lactarius psammicola]|nr:hypothetical protein BJY52DRAFT_1280399 [Lactarius psammicola]